ncbi:Acyl-coenzyme A dehydrogenase FadE [hydrothermal vent metagenome]|uniref:Acyl-coenzyme A dehydrogenase n=1 Tax=hydrothermal vent metagenome TaxID=652676 RepID=A0A3B1ADG8_9ZZZZ
MVRYITYFTLSLSILVLVLFTTLPIEISIILFGVILFDFVSQVRLYAAVSEQEYGWRIRYITAPILKLFRKVSPDMSQTEREAINAGTVWWDGELFSGKPRWKKLRKLQLPRLSEEEQAFLDGPVNELCSMLDDWQITHEQNDLSKKVWAFIKEKKFLSMIIPKAYGGLEYSALAHSAVVMKISTRSVSAAVSVMVPNSLGPGKLLLEYGTQEQKDYYLPRLAVGKEIPCFGLTNPEAGSDAGAIPDYGIVCRGNYQDQKDVLGIKLTWNKRYITLGPVSTLLGLAVKLFDPDHLLGDTEELGVTLAMVPTETPGVNIGRRHAPLNIVFMNGPNSGKDVFLPMEFIIGGQERIGQGWRMLMECLADGRSISLPALSVGSGKLASRYVGSYARVRRQFRMPIGRFEGVEEALARIGGYTYMMDAARVLTAGALDIGEKPSVISAIVKYHLTEHMRQVINDAMDVVGGAGICLGPKNILGRAYQAVPISITVEGANILTRSMIIFGQGAIRSHPYIFQEMSALDEEDWDESVKKFDSAFTGHIRFFISNFARSLLHGLTGSVFVYTGAKRPASKYYKKLTRISAAFGMLADVSLLTLGASLKRKEMISARLGDILSYMYLATAVLKRFEMQGCIKEDIPLLKWNCDMLLYKTQLAIEGLLQNLPNRFAAILLRIVIFPIGRWFKPPSDKLGQQIAQLLLTPSQARDRLTKGMYMPLADSTDTIAALEDALVKVIKAEHIEKRLKKELKGYQPGYQVMDDMLKQALEQNTISEDEANVIREAETARWGVIQVDDFSPDLK